MNEIDNEKNLLKKFILINKEMIRFRIKILIKIGQGLESTKWKLLNFDFIFLFFLNTLIGN